MKTLTLFVSTLLLFLIIVVMIATLFHVSASIGQTANSTNISSPNDSLSLSLTTPSYNYNYSLGQSILISGHLSGSSDLAADQIIKIEAFGNSTFDDDDEDPYYQAYVRTNNEGKFNLTIPSLQPEFVQVVATYPPNQTLAEAEAGARLTVLVNPAPPQRAQTIFEQLTMYGGALVPFFAAVMSIVILVLSYPKYEKVGLILATISSVIGTLFLPDLVRISPTAAATIETSLLGLLGAHVYKAISARRVAGRRIEQAIGQDRDTQLRTEVDSLSHIFEELSSHQVIFRSRNDMLSHRLSSKQYETSIKTGEMANLPGLRINQYYYYVSYYNKLAEYKVRKLEVLSDNQKYQEFVPIFLGIKNSYSKLNQLLYANILYSIGEIRNRFLSFPTVEFPIRVSTPLLDLLRKAEVPVDNGVSPEKIYSDENGYKLMRIIGKEFTEAFNELETYIDSVVALVPPPSEKEEVEGKGNGEEVKGKEKGNGEEVKGTD
jgi:hypothetical protein